MAGDGFLATTVVALFLGVVPAGLVGIGLVALIGKRRFVRRAHRTTGIVVSLEREVPGRPKNEVGKFGRPAWRPEFRYTDAAGRELTARTARATVAFNFPVDSEQTILVDPENPKIADIPGAGYYAMPILQIVSGIVFGLVGVCILGGF